MSRRSWQYHRDERKCRNCSKDLPAELDGRKWYCNPRCQQQGKRQANSIRQWRKREKVKEQVIFGDFGEREKELREGYWQLKNRNLELERRIRAEEHRRKELDKEIDWLQATSPDMPAVFYDGVHTHIDYGPAGKTVAEPEPASEPVVTGAFSGYIERGGKRESFGEPDTEPESTDCNHSWMYTNEWAACRICGVMTDLGVLA